MKQQDFGFSGRQLGWLRMITLGIALSAILASVWTPGRQGGVRVALAQATPVTTTCRVTVDKLRLREGPGVAFRAITLLSINTSLLATEVTSNLQWIKVRVASANQTGWVSVRAQNQTYVRCNLAVTRLPRSQSVPATPMPTPYTSGVVVTSLPLPTPTATPTVTPTPYNSGYTSIPNNAEGTDGRIVGQIRVPSALLVATAPLPIFRDRLVFELLASTSVTAPNGTGIGVVDITINDNSTGQQVYHRADDTAPYCTFDTSQSDCEQVWVFAQTNYHWPKPDQDTIEAGDFVLDPNTTYTVQMNITFSDGSFADFWTFNFAVANQQTPSDPTPTFTSTPPAVEVTDLYANIVQTGPNTTNPAIFGELVFQVEAFDPSAGNNDGAGIENVDLDIFGPDGSRVYHRTEGSAHYCAFAGGEPDCNVFRFTIGDNWSEDGPPIEAGTHTLRATVHAQDGRSKIVEIQIQI